MTDITPEHHPAQLVRSLDEAVKTGRVKSAFIAWEDEDGALHREGCAFESRDLLWCIRRLEHFLMLDKD